MYKWDKNEINMLINYLESMKNPREEALEDLELLKMIKNRNDKKGSIKETIKFNLENDDIDFKELIGYESIILPVIDKYADIETTPIKYKKIESSKKDIMHFAKRNIKKIDPTYLELLDKFLDFDKIDVRNNNPNHTIYLTYLNKVFVSINKENKISDFYNPTHELLHAYYFYKNPKSYNHIENEFLSILGEMITSYDLIRKCIFGNEALKNDIESFNTFINYIKSIVLKRYTILNNIESNNRIKFLKDELFIPKVLLKDIYSTTLDYNYKYVIGYVLALELFDLYIHDKEKCLYIVDKIIMSNEPLEKKLKDNNITLLEHSDKCIKILQKSIQI